VFIRRRPHQLSIPNQFYQQKEKSTNLNPPNPHDFKTRLNPKAPEFIGVQACKLSFNPDADEFTPFGVDLVGPLSPASTNSSSSFSDIHGQEQCGNEVSYLSSLSSIKETNEVKQSNWRWLIIL
jgi:hypothetical protein